MSTKRLYRSKKDRVISGICGGIGEYFDIDPVIIRIIAVILVFMGGSGIIAYIIGIFIIPENPGTEVETNTEKKKEPAVERKAVKKEETAPQTANVTGALLIGIILIVIGGFFLMRNFPIFDDYYWWIRNHVRHFFWPGVLVVLGVFLITKSLRK